MKNFSYKIVPMYVGDYCSVLFSYKMPHAEVERVGNAQFIKCLERFFGADTVAPFIAGVSRETVFSSRKEAEEHVSNFESLFEFLEL